MYKQQGSWLILIQTQVLKVMFNNNQLGQVNTIQRRTPSPVLYSYDETQQLDSRKACNM